MESDNSENENSTDSPKRQTWASQLDFIMSAVGCAVGLGNIWRFPYLCYKNGGGAFLIPYLVSYFLVAAPTFIMEIGLSQYTSSGCVRAWTIAPAFQGIGIACQVIIGWANLYYIIVLVWALYYLAMSFTSDLPWASCGNTWNTDRCFVTGMSLANSTPVNCSDVIRNVTSGIDDIITNATSDMNCSSYNVTPLKPIDAVVEYWENGVLRISGGLEQPGGIVPGLALSLFVAWFLVFVCICKGVQWTGKIVYFTAVFPYVLLTVLFVRGVTLEGAADGLIFYLKPDFSRLGDAQVWIDGGTQVLYSMGIGQGFMFTLGSYNKFNVNCVRNSVFILMVNVLTSVFAGTVVFMILGFMANEMKVPVKDVVDSGPGLVFLAYPKAVTQLPLSSFWAAMFFLMIIFLGLDSEFVAVEGFLTPIIDKFPNTLYKTRNRMIFVGIYCFCCFLFGLSMVSEGGIYLFRLMDNYTCSGLVLLVTCFMEVVTVGWIFGADRFYDILEMMTGNRLGPWLKISWKYTAPAIVTAIFIFELVTYKSISYSNSYQYPDWALVLGVFFTLSSTLCIPAHFLYYFLRSSGSLNQRWRDITKPILKKHQIDPRWKQLGYTWTLEEYESYDVNNLYDSANVHLTSVQ